MQNAGTSCNPPAFSWLLALHIAAFLSSAITPAADPQPGPIRVGVLGDSFSDEWGIHVPDAANWVELLAAAKLVDFGPMESFEPPDPRAVGGRSYRHNFALAGANVQHLLRGKSHFTTPAVSLFRAAANGGAFEYGLLEIGGNSVLGSLAHRRTERNWSLFEPGSTAAKHAIANLAASYTEVLDRAAAGTNVKMILATLCDLGSMPVATNGIYVPPLDKAARERLRSNIRVWNERIRALAAERGYGVMEIWDWWETIRTEPLQIGEQHVDAEVALTVDGIHPTRIGHALLANRFLAALAAEPYEDSRAKPLTPGQMLALFNLDTSPSTVEQ